MNEGKKYRRIVTEHGIYLRKRLYDHPKLKSYLGKNLVIFSNNGTLEVHSFHSGFICYFKESEGIPINPKNKNWGGLKAVHYGK